MNALTSLTALPNSASQEDIGVWWQRSTLPFALLGLDAEHPEHEGLQLRLANPALLAWSGFAGSSVTAARLQGPAVAWVAARVRAAVLAEAPIRGSWQSPVDGAVDRIELWPVDAATVAMLVLPNLGTAGDVQSLQLEVQLAGIVAQLAGSFVDPSSSADFDAAIEHALLRLGLAVAADRAYVFDYHPDRGVCTNTHEWCRTGIEPQIGTLQAVPLAELTEWLRTHQRGEAVVIPDVALHPEASIRAILEPQQVLSLLTVPMLLEGICVGFVGFDWVRARHRFGEQEVLLLRAFTQMLGAARQRRGLEHALKEERRRLEDIIEGTHAGAWEWNLKTRAARYNERWAEMLGHVLCELTPTTIDTWEQRVHPEDLPLALEQLSKHYAGQQRFYVCELRMRHRDGYWIWVLARGRVADWTPDLKPLLVSGTHQDISVRKRAEAELRQSEAYLRAIIENLPGLAWLKDTEGRYLAVNRAMVRSCGHRADAAVIGRTDQDLFPAELAAKYRADDLRVIERMAPMTVVEQILDHHRPRWSETCHAPVLGNDGRVLGTAGYARDITLQREADARLRASEQRFRQLVENVPGIAVQGYGADLRVRFWNSGSERLYGWTAREARGRSLLDLIIPPAMRNEVREAVQAWLAGGPPIPPSELLLLHRDGSPRPVYSSHLLQQNAAGESELFCIDLDLRELKAAEARQRLTASVFTHSHEGILITDAEARIVEVNEAYCRMTGYGREALIGRDPRFLRAERQEAAVYAAMWAALKSQGHWSGEVWNRRRDGREYAQALTVSAVQGPDGRVSNYVGLCADITERKSQQQHLERIAHFDVLTGLPNRVLLVERLRQAMLQTRRRGGRLALAYIDLDNFKAINDHYDHALGDRMLAAVGQRMRDALRESDTVARIGGDEFVVLLADLTDGVALQPLLDRLQQALSKPVVVDTLELPLSASIGVTLYPQDAELDAEQLLRQADQAMYGAKHAGRRQLCQFDAGLEQRHRARAALLADLRMALSEQQLLLVYQPTVDLARGAVDGVEALVRWQHPTRGLLYPADFLPLLEGDDLGLKLGEWVLGQALADAARWRAAGLELRLSVNLSAQQLQHGDFPQVLAERLKAVPMPPGGLLLEILESSMLQDLEQAAQVIRRCNELGVEFALDDFGTGWSSLRYLKDLPLAELKIDRSFVREMLDDPADRAIVEGIVGLSRAFEIDVIAEGVEQAAQAEALLALGCRRAQGWGIARAMPATAIPAWIAGWDGRICDA
ncbi:MAG: EAL domain-containing protein [Xanthomonadales bacterium]|nr:EAL domain-containing protein [Xanthomonadales bacterium]